MRWKGRISQLISSLEEKILLKQALMMKFQR